MCMLRNLIAGLLMNGYWEVMVVSALNSVVKMRRNRMQKD